MNIKALIFLIIILLCLMSCKISNASNFANELPVHIRINNYSKITEFLFNLTTSVHGIDEREKFIESSFLNAKKLLTIIKEDNSDYISQKKIKHLVRKDYEKISLILGVLQFHNYIDPGEAQDFIREVLELQNILNEITQKEEKMSQYMIEDLVVSLQKKFRDIYGLSVDDRTVRYSVSYYGTNHRKFKAGSGEEDSHRSNSRFTESEIINVLNAYHKSLQFFNNLIKPNNEEQKKDILLRELIDYVNNSIERYGYSVRSGKESIAFKATINYFNHIINREQLLFFTRKLLFENKWREAEVLFKYEVFNKENNKISNLLNNYAELININSKDEQAYLSLINELNKTLQSNFHDWLKINTNFENAKIDSLVLRN